VVLSSQLPWEAFASIAISMMNRDIDRSGLCPPMVLGALSIKHQENIADSGPIAAIQENVYLQFFIGLKEFSMKPIVDPHCLLNSTKE
jgi:hypothetical protein